MKRDHNTAAGRLKGSMTERILGEEIFRDGGG